MGQITTQEARGVFTKMLVDVYRETIRPTAFLRSFFPVVETETKELSIEVMRGTEKVAVDVLRGTEGNRNTMSRSSEKIFIPPYFREWFDATELDFYDRLFAASGGQVDVVTLQLWLATVAEKLRMLQDKIERAYEVQCAEVLIDGIVTIKNGVNIDYTRKALSLVDLGGGNYWDEANTEPIKDLTVGARFLRTAGKSEGAVITGIFGELALEALLQNASVKERADVRNFQLDDVTGPVKDSVGGAFHGRITIGSYKLDLWTYPQFRDVGGVSTPYIDAKKVVLIPSKPNFKLAFAGVPKVFRDRDNAEMPAFIAQEKGAFSVGNFVDDRGEKHVFEIKSAGLAIPTAVDQIHTTQVLAP